jgi:hypothetical protein
MEADKATLKKIDTLYKTTKQMPLVTILGLAIPLIMLIAGCLSFLYASWRKKILAATDAGHLHVPDKDKIQYLRQHKLRLLLPGYILIAEICVVIMLIIIASLVR